MIIIKELTPPYYDAFMNYLNKHHITKPFTLDKMHPIWMILDGSELKGFLSSQRYEKDFAILECLMADQEEPLKDGLIRAAFNSLCKQDVQWVLCDETFYQQEFPLKEHFCPIESNKELYKIASKHLPYRILDAGLYYVKSSIIYRTGCKGGLVGQ